MSAVKFWVGCWLVLASGSCFAVGTQVTDDRGVTHVWATPPQRIVSLLPSLTETVCTLNACDRLVGVDRYSNWPAAVQGLPKLGGGIDPSVEAVLAQRPDAVLIARSSRAVEQLQALGLTVVVLEPTDLAGVQRVIAQVGQLLGLDAAQTALHWQVMDQALSTLAQSLPASSRGARVYFEVNNAPYGASESSFIGELLTRLGARNILPAAMGPFPRVNPEFVVRADPDLIMVGDQTSPGLTQRPGWAKMRALRQQRLCVFSPADSDVLVRPGPRMAEAARLMADCLRRKAP
ncbi:helical backbone metal receptor [Hydrogenophaga sp.]|uniref:ABC transporter substrate-binding protein n=1 Tax=Hydrogenophaga sp. TaxID=1904254 RepID=UPI0025C1AD92|nr:helical backbone metal receptor [Hydrogenophaga sp.]